METIIANLQASTTAVQALGVSAGGLIGVFATLTVFFLIIWVSDKIGKKEE